MNPLKNILAYLFGKSQGYYYGKRYDDYRRKYNLKSDFGFNGTDIRIYGEGKLILGNNSYIGSYSTMQVYKDCTIKIGDHCQLSHNVRMYTQTDVSDQDLTSKDKKTKTGDIFIEDGVWIGVNVFIGPGVRIGKNSIVGANSVVVSDIEPNSIWGGVPAKLVRKKSS